MWGRRKKRKGEIEEAGGRKSKRQRRWDQWRDGGFLAAAAEVLFTCSSLPVAFRAQKGKNRPCQRSPNIIWHWNLFHSSKWLWRVKNTRPHKTLSSLCCITWALFVPFSSTSAVWATGGSGGGRLLHFACRRQNSQEETFPHLKS